MRICRTCKEERDDSLFYPRYATCKICTKERYKEQQKVYYKANSDKICERTNKYYKANQSKYLQHRKDCRKNNPEREAAAQKKRRDADLINNRAKEALYSTARRRQKEIATPAWACKKKMLEIYIEAQEKGLHVDHIIPLKNKLVCGLHCQDNLRAIPQNENQIKGNTLIEDIV